MPPTPEIGTAAELAALFPGARRVRVIEPLNAANPTASRAQTAVIVRPLNAIEAAQLVGSMQPLIDAYDPAQPPIQLLTKHMPTVVEMAAVSTDRAAEWLLTLDAGDLLDVAVAVLEANENFLRRVVDLVAGATGKKLTAIFSSVGQTPSSVSPTTASPQRKPLSSLRQR